VGCGVFWEYQAGYSEFEHIIAVVATGYYSAGGQSDDQDLGGAIIKLEQIEGALRTSCEGLQHRLQLWAWWVLEYAGILRFAKEAALCWEDMELGWQGGMLLRDQVKLAVAGGKVFKTHVEAVLLYYTPSGAERGEGAAGLGGDSLFRGQAGADIHNEDAGGAAGFPVPGREGVATTGRVI
jgi:hypothetical protein